MVQQIHTTNESVKKIREATELITSIASQTNLLSLNASIEAARAGSAGDGFAVVAKEVGKLSGRSSVVNKEIEEIVQNINSAVEAMRE